VSHSQKISLSRRGLDVSLNAETTAAMKARHAESVKRSAAMRAAEIQRGGRTWPAPLIYWQNAFEAVLNAAHQGSLSLPLKSHGYLLEVIARMGSKGEAKAETLREQQRAGHAGVGAPPERAKTAVVSHEPAQRTGMPEHVREELRLLTRALRQKESE